MSTKSTKINKHNVAEGATIKVDTLTENNTVAEGSSAILDRHLLEDKWTWYFKGKTIYKKNQSEKDWLSGYNKVYQFQTVEMFWRVFNNIPKWLSMPFGITYAMFKDDVTPSWEHPKNSTGYSVVFYLNRHKPIFDTHPSIYEDMVLSTIGCQFEEIHEIINGITFERKYKGDKIVFWFGENDIFKNTEKSNKIIRNMLLGLELVEEDYDAPPGTDPGHFYVLKEQDKMNDIRFKETSVLARVVDHEKELAKCGH